MCGIIGSLGKSDVQGRLVTGLSHLKYRSYDSAGVAIMHDAKAPVSKAVFPLAGFDTRFLTAMKVMLKERMLIVDKSLIQYAVEEARPAAIDTLIFVKGQNNRVISDIKVPIKKSR